MAGASRDHVHMVWANSSEGSSSQSETPQIFQQMRFLPGTDSRNGLSQSASFSPYISMLAQNSSSSSSTSQEVTRLQQQQQQQQFLHDFHVNFPASSGPAPPGGPRQVPKGPPGALNAAYAAMETEAKRTNPPSMEGGQWQSLPKQQPCPPQLKFASASSSGQAAPVAAEGRVKEGHPSKGSVGHDKGNCRPCHYFHSRTGCANGDQCNFCHLKHPKRSRVRIPKQYRQQCRALAQLVYDTQGCDKEIRQEMELQLLIQTSFDHRLTAYATSVLKSLRGGAVLQDFPQGLAHGDDQARKGT
ncbi:unnamed protein product [Cladocopium goreaui]|uniref:C3H1-type domain-containing protein n=1 Tax=Cladocopium goreaui TaxID=2562237 RepID=A0A9P1GP88_9DINO|nr:unnamed protein product [Cladocopium goreaui]|mmetsp:Transcript_55493/g.121475  ORF Transcript_55493/g.121475 Transcript_55493/m.121475 type:complete len:301 (+) Transcript_55493:61-963(+)